MTTNTIDDDYYCEEDYEPDETHYEEHLCKAPNGHPFIGKVHGWKFRGQDWGETVGQWETSYHNIRDWNEEFVQKCIDAGKGIPAGENIPLRWAFEEDEEEDEIEVIE